MTAARLRELRDLAEKQRIGSFSTESDALFALDLIGRLASELLPLVERLEAADTSTDTASPNAATGPERGVNYLRHGRWALCLHCGTVNVMAGTEHYCGAWWQQGDNWRIGQGLDEIKPEWADDLSTRRPYNELRARVRELEGELAAAKADVRRLRIVSADEEIGSSVKLSAQEDWERARRAMTDPEGPGFGPGHSTAFAIRHLWSSWQQVETELAALQAERQRGVEGVVGKDLLLGHLVVEAPLTWRPGTPVTVIPKETKDTP